MADTLTTNYELVKIEVGGSNDTWGDKLNTNFDEIDAILGDLEEDKVSSSALLTEKVTVVDNDTFFGGDSAATFATKKWKWSTLKLAVTTYLASVGLIYATGDMKHTAAKTIPSGWLRADGSTIGNATSGATRANADTAALFTVLWDSFANTELAILNSAGAASSRGASAAADYAANKRLPLPDARGRTIAGFSAAGSRISSPSDLTFGDTGGAADHTLTTAQMPIHSHTSGTLGGSAASAGGHSHSPAAGGNFLVYGVGGSLGGLTAGSQMTYGSTAAVGGHTHVVDVNSGSTANAGSGSAHNNTQPTIVLNILIKL